MKAPNQSIHVDATCNGPHTYLSYCTSGCGNCTCALREPKQHGIKIVDNTGLVLRFTTRNSFHPNLATNFRKAIGYLTRIVAFSSKASNPLAKKQPYALNLDEVYLNENLSNQYSAKKLAVQAIEALGIHYLAGVFEPGVNFPVKNSYFDTEFLPAAATVFHKIADPRFVAFADIEVVLVAGDSQSQKLVLLPERHIRHAWKTHSVAVDATAMGTQSLFHE